MSKPANMLKRIIPALRYLERFIRPRWPTPFEITKRVIGGFVLLLGGCLLAPLPLSNVPVSLTIVLLAFAYLEEDGILLALALVIALGLFAVGAWRYGARLRRRSGWEGEHRDIAARNPDVNLAELPAPAA